MHNRLDWQKQLVRAAMCAITVLALAQETLPAEEGPEMSIIRVFPLRPAMLSAMHAIFFSWSASATRMNSRILPSIIRAFSWPTFVTPSMRPHSLCS